MIYNADTGLIGITAHELITVARRGIRESQTYDDESIRRAAPGKEELTLIAEAGEVRFSVTGAVTLSGECRAELNFEFESERAARAKSADEQVRGEAYVLAALYLSGHSDAEKFTFNINRCITANGATLTEELIISRRDAFTFLNRCAEAAARLGKIEIERVTVRLPSMRGAKFPYGKAREGQAEMIRRAYRAISRGTELFCEAPTGTGKTVSALYPAIRAMGDGRCEKAFYFTPKATGAAAAADCVRLMCEGGAKIRAVVLTAKEKLCNRGHVCREGRHLCITNRKNNVIAATLALAERNLPVVMADDIISVASEYTVCPHELALTYSELCDVVICDVNYLFDPQAYIRRYFTHGGQYAFLIDEAHNLAERAREMYSAEITLNDIASPVLCELLSGGGTLCRAMPAAEEAFRAAVMPLLRDEVIKDKDGVPHAAYHTREMPSDFYTVFPALICAAEEDLYEAFRSRTEDGKERASAIREYVYKIKKFADAISRFGEGYELFIFLDGDEVRAKIFCIDTAGELSARLRLGRASIIFSATMTPLTFYRSVLGGDRSSDVLTVNSPFANEQLFVGIMNNVTTRTSEREKSLGAISGIIAATLSAKRGNYMIFTPSFAYAEALFRRFSTKYPKIRAILQKPSMNTRERDEFLAEFSKNDGKYLAAFCVMGGVFAEGVDLTGDKLIGAVVVGIGMPALSYEREAIAAYYQDRLDSGTEYAYLYPGMNRVLQAAGRVIRTERDRGVIVLVDDRFNDPLYKKLMPTLWHGVKFLPDAVALKEKVEEFWMENEE